MSIAAWWRRHFTLDGRDAAWRERYARRHGHAYPGHVPPRPMPAPAPAPKMCGPNVNPDPPGRVPRPSPWPPALPSARPVGPISLAERAARFQRGMEVIHELSPDCLRILSEDGRILSRVAANMTELPPPPPRPRHHGMFIVAGEMIPAGQVIHLDAHADGSFIARARRIGP